MTVLADPGRAADRRRSACGAGCARWRSTTSTSTPGYSIGRLAGVVQPPAPARDRAGLRDPGRRARARRCTPTETGHPSAGRRRRPRGQRAGVRAGGVADRPLPRRRPDRHARRTAAGPAGLDVGELMAVHRKRDAGRRPGRPRAGAPDHHQGLGRPDGQQRLSVALQRFGRAGADRRGQRDAPAARAGRRRRVCPLWSPPTSTWTTGYALEEVVAATGARAVAHAGRRRGPADPDRDRSGTARRYGSATATWRSSTWSATPRVRSRCSTATRPACPTSSPATRCSPAASATPTRTRSRFTSLIGDVESKLFDRLPDETWFYPGHGTDSTLGAERPSLPEWRARGW